jgi:hypothetical protein
MILHVILKISIKGSCIRYVFVCLQSKYNYYIAKLKISMMLPPNPAFFLNPILSTTFYNKKV